MEAFVQLELIPGVVQKGNRIQILDIPALKIRFLNSSSYLKGTIYEIATQYQINFNPTYFPDSWNKTEHYHYEGTKPDLSDFFCFSDTADERLNKKIWHDLKSNDWIMKEELNSALQNETLIFTKSMLCFLKQSFELQDKLASTLSEIPSAIHPFGSNVSSLSSFTYAVYCFYYMNKYEVFSVMNPYSNTACLTSAGEYEWIRFKL